MTSIQYSWILPIYNEHHSLPQLFEEIQKSSLVNYEIIAISDGSKDNSLKTLKKLAQNNKQSIKIIHFKTHQGKWAAIAAGFKISRGQIIITLDSDLQDDPTEIKKLINKLNQGYNLVSGWRKDRHDPTYKVIISKLGNWLASILTSHNFKDLNSPFKVYRRGVLESLPKQGSMLRFSMLFAERLGYKVAEVPINHRLRVYGQSKFGVIKYIRILYDLILIMLLFSGSGRLKKLKT